MLHGYWIKKWFQNTITNTYTIRKGIYFQISHFMKLFNYVGNVAFTQLILEILLKLPYNYFISNLKQRFNIILCFF